MRGRALLAGVVSSPVESQANLSLQEQLPSLCLWPAPSWHSLALSWLPDLAPALCRLHVQRARGLWAPARPSRDWNGPAHPSQPHCGPQRRALALRSERGEGCWAGRGRRWRHGESFLPYPLSGGPGVVGGQGPHRQILSLGTPSWNGRSPGLASHLGLTCREAGCCHLEARELGQVI